MGIKNLTKLLAEMAPGCLREHDLNNYTGRKVAIDASMALYSFLIAVRSAGAGGGASQMLTNADGEVTSHIQGMFNRTIRLLSQGVKPVFVFDGRPPTLKSGELAKRSERRAQAEVELKAAEEEGTVEDVEKYQKRLVRVTRQQNEEVKELLRLMGVPVVDAPMEAEAQCAELAREGRVFATGTEDMDALTFRTPVLLRRLTFGAAAKMPVLEIRYDRLLSELELTPAQFRDLCILCGCDYCDTIRGIGPKRALQLIKEHGNIETIVQRIDRSKYQLPDSYLGENPIFVEARRLFTEHEVTPAAEVELNWTACNEQGLTEFLVDRAGFAPERVAAGIARLKAARGVASQQRMDSFFSVVPNPNAGAKPKNKKRAAAAVKGKKGAAKRRRR